MLAKILTIIVVSGACGIAMTKFSKLREEAFMEKLDEVEASASTEDDVDFTEALEGVTPGSLPERIVMGVMAVPAIAGVFSLATLSAMLLTFFISIPLMIMSPAFRSFVLILLKVLGLSTISISTFAICKHTTN